MLTFLNQILMTQRLQDRSKLLTWTARLNDYHAEPAPVWRDEFPPIWKDNTLNFAE